MPTEVLQRLDKLNLASPYVDHKAAERALSRAIAGMGLLPLKPVWTTEFGHPGEETGWGPAKGAFSSLTAHDRMWNRQERPIFRVLNQAWQHFAPRVVWEQHGIAVSAAFSNNIIWTPATAATDDRWFTSVSG